ncbi:hypothetical protein ACGFY3_39085 [Streptomyces mirabilis]|uniref:hypothetical protein n=1 Tax=Streptomyces mirabilis TaxID=68239 RepID=UPI003711746E
MLLVPAGAAQAAPGDNPNKVILSGWGQNGTTTDHMGRIAFIDANDPSNFKYRWVLSVIPLNGGTDYRRTRRTPSGCRACCRTAPRAVALRISTSTTRAAV